MTGVRQPAGTVTLVFTDIEGSTKLLEELGLDAYRDALDDHRRAVRAAFGRQRGYEVDYEGDSFFYAFPTADGAVTAARDAVAALEPGLIRIRVGIHTGKPGLDPPKYVGLDVHRAARIMSGAHGGQIVLSRATADLVDGAFDLTDLGDHRFKDISEPERVFQLGREEHPPLRSLFRTSLPVPATRFLGREDALASVGELLARPDVRLVTLTGTGGTGKSRLAIEAAERASGRFPDGTTWVGLAALRNAELVLPSIARALGMDEHPGDALGDALAARLLGTSTLLVVDNAEHLLPGVATDIAALLASCPTLRILVTSRERLRIDAETVWPVPTLAQDDAERLLVERASAAGVDVEVDAAARELCRRLDHLPLAVELAAARLSLFTPAELLEQVTRRLDVLTGHRDSDPRQQTLEATIDWSYELLTDEERRTYRALGFLAGGATLEAIEAICEAGPDIVQTLVDKSLVRRRADGPTSRFWMLETVRHHASTRSDPDEARATLRRAVGYVVGLVTSFEDEAVYSGSATWGPAFRAEEATVLGLLAEAPARGLVDEALELAVLSSQLWFELGTLQQAAIALESIVDRPDVLDKATLAQALRSLGRVEDKRGRREDAVRRCTAALELCTELGDREAECVASGSLGAVLWTAGDMAAARSFQERSLAIAEELGDDLEIARASYNLACIVTELDDSYANAVPLLEQSYRAARRVGHTAGTILCLQAIGEARTEAGDRAAAFEALTECLTLAAQTHHEVHIPGILESLAEAAVAVGARKEAAQFLATADELRGRHGSAVAAPHADTQRELRESLADESAEADRALDVTGCVEVANGLAAAGAA